MSHSSKFQVIPSAALAAASPLTMSSREIAELLGCRHDNVKRTIETLAAKRVIESPQSEEIPTATRPVQVYRIGKRDSYVIVAQLSPEFTARLVDRWQELEEQAKAARPVLALPNFTDPAEAAIAWAQEFKAKQAAEAQAHILA
jgi:phage regulator Rha-like protein